MMRDERLGGPITFLLRLDPVCDPTTVDGLWQGPCGGVPPSSPAPLAPRYATAGLDRGAPPSDPR